MWSAKITIVNGITAAPLRAISAYLVNRKPGGDVLAR